MHREGDIRRQAADLMGNIIVNYDEDYRKELPEGVQADNSEINSIQLWERYLEMIIQPDHKVTERHRRWIGYALRRVVDSVLSPVQDRRSGGVSSRFSSILPGKGDVGR